MIKRDRYIKQLIAKKDNGLVKIITGVRRCGKSYLLFTLYKNYLNNIGVDDSHIIQIALDKRQHFSLRDPNKLYEYVIDKSKGEGRFYVFIDEIQLSYRIKRDDIDENRIAPEDRELMYVTFYDILNDLMSRSNLDIYVTGSNSRMLSKDVATNFRGRGTEIRVYPLSFAEFYEYAGLEKFEAWEEYMSFGGMPLVALESSKIEKAEYLRGLFSKIYISNIKERYKLRDEEALSNLINVIFSAVGSLSNPHKLNNTMNSVLGIRLSDHTVAHYLEYLEDAFIIKKAVRYDVKGKSYLDFPSKYYAVDVGLRNARLNFRQQEKTHIMENIIYNELVCRGYSVDVGVVPTSSVIAGTQRKQNLEIDFVVNHGFSRTYIQSAFSIENEDKREQEIRSLLASCDFFRKIVIVNGNELPHQDENGITYVGVIPFLLSPEFLNV